MSIVLSLVVAVFVLWFIRRLHWVWRVNRIPGVGWTPCGILGDVGFVRDLMATGLSPLQNFEPVVEKYRKIVGETGLLRIWLGPIPHLIVTDADYAENILSSNELITKGFQYKFARSWLGDGLILSTGNKWRNRRKMLTPSFHFQILDQFIPIMNRNGNVLIQQLTKEADANGGQVRDLIHFLLPCTLDVICETAMGLRLDSQTDPDGRYIRAVYEATGAMMKRFLTPWLFYDTIYMMTANGQRHQQVLEELHAFTNSAIKSRMKEILSRDHEVDDEDIRRKEPFMDTLIRRHIQDPKGFTEEDIREEVDNFMFAGHDTTAWGVVWCTYLLGHHPGFQQRLHEEVDSAYADKEKDEDLTMEDLKGRLNYTEAVLKEAQRVYPTVPLFMRSITSDVRILDYDVPAGTQIMVLPNLLHGNPKYWPNAKTFDPERFLSGEKHHPFAFIPFSAGPRNCIGQRFAMLEQKALIAKIFRKFKVTSLDARESMKPLAAAIRKSNVPIRLRLEVR